MLRHWTRRDKLSVISGLSVSPIRHRVGLYYQWHAKNIQQTEVCAFLRHLLRHLRGPVIILWDNGRPHQGDLLRALCRRVPRLRLERFPAYAPDLNPDEGVWTLTKAALANGRPDDLDALVSHLLESLEGVRGSQATLRGCVLQSELPPLFS